MKTRIENLALALSILYKIIEDKISNSGKKIMKEVICINIKISRVWFRSKILDNITLIEK